MTCSARPATRTRSHTSTVRGLLPDTTSSSSSSSSSSDDHQRKTLRELFQQDIDNTAAEITAEYHCKLAGQECGRVHTATGSGQGEVSCEGAAGDQGSDTAGLPADDSGASQTDKDVETKKVNGVSHL